MSGLAWRAVWGALVCGAMIHAGGLEAAPSVERTPDGEALLYTKLTEEKAQQGQDYALIHYIHAGWLMPPDMSPAEKAAMQQVLSTGKAEANDAALISALSQCQPAFQEFRAGTELGGCHDGDKGGPHNPPGHNPPGHNPPGPPGHHPGDHVPSPCFPTLFSVPKALCAEGLILEAQGKYGDALNTYVDVLQFSRDVGNSLPNATMFPVALTAGQLGANRIRKLTAKGKLSAEELAIASREIRRSLAENATPRLILDEETTVALATAQKAKADVTAQKALESHDLQAQYFETPYTGRDRDGHAKAMKALTPKTGGVPDMTQIETRHLVMVSVMRQALAAAAVEQYKLARGTYPASLKDSGATATTDPFGTGEFRYILNADRSGYEIYSVGPDGTDQSGEVMYDPAAGVTSAGDIVTTSPEWK
ncbi:MAG: type II secretion system protein GspG [Candidatus Sumerlaeaceae bacterium]|nr:type II secretion system protein GspG [Candidatus Sumerlaeaceae bacterium]